jgi:hypothetical protein
MRINILGGGAGGPHTEGTSTNLDPGIELKVPDEATTGEQAATAGKIIAFPVLNGPPDYRRAA